MRKVRSWYGPDTKEVECLYRYDKGKEDLDHPDEFKLRGYHRPRNATRKLTNTQQEYHVIRKEQVLTILF